MIRKVKEGYRVLSENGRNMGTYKTEEEAKKRLQQIEFFKHKNKEKKVFVKQNGGEDVLSPQDVL